MSKSTRWIFTRFSQPQLKNYVIAGLYFAFSVSAHASVTVQMRVATHHEPSKSDATIPADTVTEEQLILGEHYIGIKSAQVTTILDFSKRRRYVINHQTASYVDYSLFDTVGLFEMELQNRQNLAKVLAAAKLSSEPIDPLYSEQALSMQAVPGRKLDEVTDGGDLVFSVEEKPLLRRSRTGTPISAADAANFAKFLRDTAGGHPLVLNKLASAHDIPKKFTFYYRGPGSYSRSYEVGSIRDAAPDNFDLKPYTERAEGAGNEIDQLLDGVKGLQVSAFNTTRSALTAQIKTAFADKRPLDAMLGKTELVLMTGELMTPFTPEQIAQLRDDQWAQKASSVLSAQGKDALAAAIPILQELQKHTTTRKHMLLLFEANDHVGLGATRTAKPMFISVLRTNPWLAGAYKDLGDTLFRDFDTARAWRCWDAGRRLAPKLTLFSSITQYEQDLVRKFPEFF